MYLSSSKLHLWELIFRWWWWFVEFYNWRMYRRTSHEVAYILSVDIRWWWFVWFCWGRHQLHDFNLVSITWVVCKGVTGDKQNYTTCQTEVCWCEMLWGSPSVIWWTNYARRNNLLETSGRKVNVQSKSYPSLPNKDQTRTPRRRETPSAGFIYHSKS